MKYIIVEDMGLEVPIVFAEFLKHNQVVGLNSPLKVVSAGFIAFEDNHMKKPRCWGGSMSLNVKSRFDTDVQVICATLDYSI